MSSESVNSSQRAPAKVYGLSSGLALLAREFRAKKECYVSDWTDAVASRSTLGRALGAAVQLLTTSLLTSIAFGLFYQVETSGGLGIVASLASGGITGIIQAVFGGMPLTLSGQTGPVSLVYVFAFRFAEELDIPYLPWVAWIGCWTFLFHAVVAVTGLCEFRVVITPFSSMIFEMLVAADFITTGFKNLAKEFDSEDANQVLVDARLNGVLALLLALGFFSTALLFAGAGGWRFTSHSLTGFLRRFSSGIALLLWVFASWIPYWARGTEGSSETWPSGVPRRPDLQTSFGLPKEHYFLTFLDMGEVSAGAIFGAMVPAAIITVLFFVDHNISSMAAYDGGFPIKKPMAWNYDFFVLGVSALLTGLMGLPASSGLIPQNPMHSRALVAFGDEEDEDKDKQADEEAAPAASSSSSSSSSSKEEAKVAQVAAVTALVLEGADEEVVNGDGKDATQLEVKDVVNGDDKDVTLEIDSSVPAPAPTSSPAPSPGPGSNPIPSPNPQKAGADSEAKAEADSEVPAKTRPLVILDQRLSGLVHSCGLLAAIFLVPAIGWIPTSLVWAFFLVLSTEAFHVGNPFLVRTLFLATSTNMRNTWDYLMLDLLPFKVISAYTLIQLSCFAFVYVVAIGLTLASDGTWTVVGVFFPVVILLYAVPVRSHLLPKVFTEQQLALLDSAEELVRPQDEVPELPKDADEEFLPYVGRGAHGHAHVVEHDAAEAMLIKGSRENSSSESLFATSSPTQLRSRSQSSIRSRSP